MQGSSQYVLCRSNVRLSCSCTGLLDNFALANPISAYCYCVYHVPYVLYVPCVPYVLYVCMYVPCACTVCTLCTICTICTYMYVCTLCTVCTVCTYMPRVLYVPCVLYVGLTGYLLRGTGWSSTPFGGGVVLWCSTSLLMGCSSFSTQQSV